MPPRHALDVLIAFRMDVTKLRYENWDEVIHYCRYSAMPVGRFMLDVHGESTSTWAASDALCAGLQINNHLQDCAKDFRDLNRVYLPRDALAAAERQRRDAGRGEIAAGAVEVPAGARDADRDPARRKQIALRRGEGFPARARDRGDPGLCRQDRRHAEGARSAAASGCIFPRSNCSARASAASPAKSPAARSGGGPSPNRRPAHDAADGGGQRKLRHHRVRQFVLRRDAHPAARRSARRCSRSTVSAGRSTTSPIPTARGPSGWPRSSNGATISTRCIRAIRRRACRTTPRRCEPSVSSARISWPSSMAWRWTCRRTSARPILQRSTCIATASPAPSDVCRCGCSACPRTTASCLRIISAARCN